MKVGDEVMFSRQFLINTGQHTGNVPFMRGVIVRIDNLGDKDLLRVLWPDEDMHTSVLASNLVLRKDLHKERV